VADLSDDDLVRLYRDGDADAFDALFDRYHAVVYRVARAILGREPAAQDVMQETFLAVARTARRYEPRGRFRAWLMQIARNRSLNRLAADRARAAALRESGLDAAQTVSPEASPPDRAAADEEERAVWAAIGALPDRQREALALHALEGMPYREVADVLGVPMNTVKTLIHRARARVAVALEERNDDR
jgi:RNA polymerase sigma-70 factor (ECF subfamily)